MFRVIPSGVHPESVTKEGVQGDGQDTDGFVVAAGDGHHRVDIRDDQVRLGKEAGSGH
ncbi:hypothetical protein BMS3Bbin04_00224 [bacterium BMS3Bbin04]|nr:hypothetical protein BMS3Bbin04_00224 [bacterium BMS3Bbin04]